MSKQKYETVPEVVIELEPTTELETYYLPEELFYSKDLMWLKIEPDEHVIIGLTDFGQKIIGPLVLIRLRHEGKILSQGESVGRFHGSRIWFGAFRSPVSGKIVEVNKSVIADPSLVNKDPYGEGWLIQIKAPKLEEELKTLSHGEKAVTKLTKELIAERKRKPAFFW
ncbi:MAG: glycine cleavage system protein H [Candidatus Hodarchaeota archaeon]